MTMLMGQEKQRISERLERLIAEREKLSTQLTELEIAERVLARFDRKAATSGKLKRTRPANTAPAVGRKRRAQGKRQMPTMSLSDATLKAVQAHDEGATASEVLNYLSRVTWKKTLIDCEFGYRADPEKFYISYSKISMQPISRSKEVHRRA